MSSLAVVETSLPPPPSSEECVVPSINSPISFMHHHSVTVAHGSTTGRSFTVLLIRFTDLLLLIGDALSIVLLVRAALFTSTSNNLMNFHIPPDPEPPFPPRNSDSSPNRPEPDGEREQFSAEPGFQPVGPVSAYAYPWREWEWEWGCAWEVPASKSLDH